MLIPSIEYYGMPLEKLHHFVFILDRRDSSGIRFYLGKERRQHELGYLALGMDSTAAGIAIPPGAEQFLVDSYCPAEATKVSRSFPFSMNK